MLRRDVLKLGACLPLAGFVKAEEPKPTEPKVETGVWDGVRFIRTYASEQEECVQIWHDGFIFVAYDNCIIWRELPTNVFIGQRLDTHDYFKKWHIANGELYWHGEYGSCWRIECNTGFGGIRFVYEGVS